MLDNLVLKGLVCVEEWKCVPWGSTSSLNFGMSKPKCSRQIWSDSRRILTFCGSWLQYACRVMFGWWGLKSGYCLLKPWRISTYLRPIPKIIFLQCFCSSWMFHFMISDCPWGYAVLSVRRLWYWILAAHYCNKFLLKNLSFSSQKFRFIQSNCFLSNRGQDK